jgi:hypothetical protein
MLALDLVDGPFSVSSKIHFDLAARRGSTLLVSFASRLMVRRAKPLNARLGGVDELVDAALAG